MLYLKLVHKFQPKNAGTESKSFHFELLCSLAVSSGIYLAFYDDCFKYYMYHTWKINCSFTLMFYIFAKHYSLN